MSVLAIDQGTTSTRALVLENSGKATIAHVIEHQQIYPQTHWVEHDPEELIDNILQCIEKSISIYSDICSIGLDNQGESCLAWHADTKKALSPVIVWQDSRTQTTIDHLKKEGLEQQVQSLSGLPLDPYFSASKLAWIVKHNSNAHSALKQGKLCLGTTDAFFLDRLTGQCVTDITTASRTSLMNIHTGKWDEQLCQLFEVPIETLPKIVSTTADFGVVNIGTKKIAIRASICDQQASLFGHGCRNKGDIKITFGTGAFAFVITGTEPVISPKQGLLPTVAWQLNKHAAVYALDGGVYNAGAAINWAKSLGLFDSLDQINAFSKPSAVGQGLVFIPALSGLACPHWDRKAAGLWIGLSLDTTSMDMMQAVLEGIAFRAVEVVKAMDDCVPIGNQISIDGGLSNNPYFCQFLANLLKKEISVPNFSELTAIGVAQLVSGNNVEFNSSNLETTLYSPNADLSQHLIKFHKAIERSKAWY